MNLCKLADINHRINRACEHDTHQVAQWVENEQTRRSEYVTSLAQRQDRLVVLRGEDEGGMIQQAVGKLKSEISVLSKQLSQAEKEEEEARRVSYLITDYSLAYCTFSFNLTATSKISLMQ